MIKDRMQELALLTKGSIIGSKLTKPLMTDPDWDTGLKDKIKQGQRLVSDINRTTEEITKLKQEYKKSIVQENEKEISKRLDVIVKKNHSDVENLNRVVKDIEEDAKRLAEKQKDSAEARTAEAAHQNLMTKMRLAINACTQAQEEFKTTAQDKIKRHIKIIDSTLTDDQVETIASDSQQGEKLLKQALFKDHSVELQNAVSDIEDKYRDVVKLQQNINDCMKLMADLAVLVTYQGQLLNNIESVLDEGKDYVEDADAKLKKAKQQHKSAQKKICCITVGILMLIAIIVVISVLVTQVK